MEGEDFIGNEIRFPKSDGDVKTYVVCRAHATAKGGLNEPDRPEPAGSQTLMPNG